MITSPFEIKVRNVLAQIFTVSYEDYLRSSRWRKKAKAAKRRALWRCQGCGRHESVAPLQVHHRTYARLGFEIKEDLTVLCDQCHNAITQVRRKIFGRAEPRPTGLLEYFRTLVLR